MSKQYNKSEVIDRIYQYFKNNECKNLYKDGCINFIGVTKDSKENYSKVIVDYLVQHIDEFKKELNKTVVIRETSYKTNNHTGKSDFDFNKRPRGERREEKIAHAMYCQYQETPAVFGKILDYQIPLKKQKTDLRLGKIDLLSSIKETKTKPGRIYFLELKKDSSDETLLRCILEAYTYSKIVCKKKLCNDFNVSFENCEFIIAPLVYKLDHFEKQLEYVMPLVEKFDCPVEFFVWDYKEGKYLIEKMKLK